MIVLGVSALLAVAAHARAPRDAHVVRPPRGDVIEYHADPGVRDPSPGAYLPPYPGWRYTPVRAGDRLRPAFLHARYAVPPALGPPGARGTRRWFRYGPDLLLVDTRDGHVVRVVGSR